MRAISMITFVVGLFFAAAAAAQQPFEKDVVKTAKGNLEIGLIGHGSLSFSFNGQAIYVDPVGRYADYSKLPKADLILVTHAHGDHLDAPTIEALRGSATTVLLNPASVERLKAGASMKNGDVQTIHGVKVEAVPAYNVINKRDNGQPFILRAKATATFYRSATSASMSPEIRKTRPR